MAAAMSAFNGQGMSQPGTSLAEGTALQEYEALIAGLMRPRAYPEPLEQVERIDTHISTVLLAGAHAYKVRKPLKLGFLDFSTLERRREDCQEELRLNQRTAPQIYLDVVAIVGSRSAPRIVLQFDRDRDEALEFAVRMRRFDPSLTFDRLAQCRRLTPDHVDRLASAVADLHTWAQPLPMASDEDDTSARWIDGNFTELRERVHSAADRARIDALAQWSNAERHARAALIAGRTRGGGVRECHGDLHLGNIVLLDGTPVLFDAIEFNAELRFIDVMSDVAFTFMDLIDNGLLSLAWRFVSGYLEQTGDYEGLALLRLYAVYRALVRAKVALIRLQQPQVAQHVRLREHTSFEHYLALAERLALTGRGAIVVMTGLSGSGKSTVARCLADELGGVTIRSDVERKRLYGISLLANSGGAIYGAEATLRTYDRLAALAATIVAAEVPVVVDAAFLRRHERRRLRDLAAQRRVVHALVVSEAPTEVLLARVRLRAVAATDPSEADETVLQRQFEWREALATDEQADVIVIDTAGDRQRVRRQCEGVARRLARRIESTGTAGTK
jgi:aminoglycoside phosphotransferase family enzyme/predicted kinase